MKGTTRLLQIDGYTLRPLQGSDVDALAALWSDPAVTRFLPSRGAPIPRDRVEQTLQSLIGHWNLHGYGVRAIERANSFMIGYAGLRYLSELDEVEVLYALAKDYWGQGIITQAAKLAIDYGFQQAGLERIVALALPENYASQWVMEKAGLRYEKKIHCFGLDCVYYAISKGHRLI